MLKLSLAAAVIVAAFVLPARSGDMTYNTPELVLPEPESTPTVLPHSSVTETESLALPEPETEAIAPFKRCGDRETVYLTN